MKRQKAAKALKAVGKGIATTARGLDQIKETVEPHIDIALATGVANVGLVYAASELISQNDFSSPTNGLIMLTTGIALPIVNRAMFRARRTEFARNLATRVNEAIDHYRPLSWAKTLTLAGALGFAGFNLLSPAGQVYQDMRKLYLHATVSDDEVASKTVRDDPTIVGFAHPEVPDNLRSRPIIYDNIGYDPKVMFDMSDVHLNSKRDVLGRIQRTLRWKPVYRAIEARYKMPEGTLAGMIMQESYGDPVQPNSSDDGGLGLTHIQGTRGPEFGLQIYGSSTHDSDFEHGKSIRKMLERCNYDLGCAQEFDERAHIIKVLDTAARIVTEGKNKHGTWELGVQYYRMPARPNDATARSYRRKVQDWRDSINDRELQVAAEQQFNRHNSISFETYLNDFYAMSDNWGLPKYVKW